MPNTKLEISQFFRRIFRSISNFFSNIVASCKHNYCCCCYKNSYQDLFNSDDEYEEYNYNHGFINPIYTLGNKLENNLENSYYSQNNYETDSDNIYNIDYEFHNDDL